MSERDPGDPGSETKPTRLRIELEADGRTRIRHTRAGSEITTATPPEYSGPGDDFSSTDLLAAALGSCIASSMAPVALRHGLGLEDVTLEVHKHLSTSPKRIRALEVRIRLARVVTPGLLRRLERAAATCVVHRSLSDDIAVEVEFEVCGRH